MNLAIRELQTKLAHFEVKVESLIKAADERMEQRLNNILNTILTQKGEEESPAEESASPTDESNSGDVYFHVQRDSEYSKHGSAIPFEVEELNIGRGMNLTSGVFTAPIEGTYYFSFTAAAGVDKTNVYLELNDDVKAIANANKDNFQILSLNKDLILKKGDQIRLRLSDVATPGSIKENDKSNRKLTHFTGILLKSPLVGFYVRRISGFDTPKAIIPFETELVNHGSVMNLEKGVFTAPKGGCYFFKFIGTTGWASNPVTSVELKLNNGTRIAGATADGNWQPISFEIVKDLEQGDRVYVVLTSSGRLSIDFADFMGILLNGEDFNQRPTVQVKLFASFYTVSSLLFGDLHNKTSFFVSRSASFTSNYRSNIPFDSVVENLNKENAMNLSTGIFTAPQSGVYYFSFSARSGAPNTLVHLKLNNSDRIIGSAYVPDNPNNQPAFSFQSALVKLKLGDQVSLFLDQGSLYEKNYDEFDKRTYFFGLLLS